MGSHGLAHVSKEIGTATAVNAVGTLMILSMQSNIPLEEVAKAHPGPKWMQLYFPADRGYARELIMRAKAAGYSAIVPTIDSTLAYPRDNNIRNDFRIPVSLGKGNAPDSEPDIVKASQLMNRRKVDLNFDDMLWIKQETGLPVVIKGVMSPQDRDGRRSNAASMPSTSRTTADARSTACRPRSISSRASPTPCAAACRSSSTAASGAARTCSARSRSAPMSSPAGGRCSTALALGGHLGAQSVLEYLRNDLSIVMQLAGTPNIKSITRDYIAPRIA